MIITNPRTHPSNVVDNATLCCCCYCCTEIYGNEKIGQKNYRIFAQRQDCENNCQEEFWNNVDLRKAEEQLYELILSFYLSGEYQYHCHSWIKVLEGSNQAPRSFQSQHVNHPEQGSNQVLRTLQSPTALSTTPCRDRTRHLAPYSPAAPSTTPSRVRTRHLGTYSSSTLTTPSRVRTARPARWTWTCGTAYSRPPSSPSSSAASVGIAPSPATKVCT